jgi:hypothetical protein
VERPEPQAAINDVVVQIHASGFTGDELTWPSTWTDRAGRDRTPSSRSGFRRHRRRDREALCGLDSRRRNAGDRHRPDRGAAFRRPDYRLRRGTPSCQLRELFQRLRDGRLRTNIGRGCPQRCRCRLQPDRADQGKGNHPRSSVRIWDFPTLTLYTFHSFVNCA